MLKKLNILFIFFSLNTQPIGEDIGLNATKELATVTKEVASAVKELTPQLVQASENLGKNVGLGTASIAAGAAGMACWFLP